MPSSNPIVVNALTANPYYKQLLSYREFQKTKADLGKEAWAIRYKFVKGALAVDDDAVARAKKASDLGAKYAIFESASQKIADLYGRYTEDVGRVVDRIYKIKVIDHQESAEVSELLSYISRGNENDYKWTQNGKGDQTWRELKTPKFLRLGHV